MDKWEKRVQGLELEGLTRSDAQGVADAEVNQGKLKCNCNACKLFKQAIN